MARAARVRVERTIVAELIISRVDDARASPIARAEIPPNRANERYFSIAAKLRNRRTLDRIRLSGNPR